MPPLADVAAAPEVAAEPEPEAEAEAIPDVAVVEVVPAAAVVEPERRDRDDRNGPALVEVVEARTPAPQVTRKLPERTRALRVTTTRKNGRKRWSFDLLVQAPDTPGDDE